MEALAGHYPKILKLARRYITYVKFAGASGAFLGGATSVAVMSDLNRDLANTEKLLYPVAGIAAGAFVGVTFPVWIVAAPIMFVAGPDAIGKLLSLALGAIVLSDDSSETLK